MTATNVIYPTEFNQRLGVRPRGEHCSLQHSQLQAGDNTAPAGRPHSVARPFYSDVSVPPLLPGTAPALKTRSTSLGSEGRLTPAKWVERFLVGVLVGLCCIIIATYLVDHMLPKAIGQLVLDANLNDSFY